MPQALGGHRPTQPIQEDPLARPPIPPTSRRTEFTAGYLTKSEAAALRQIAEESERSISDEVRRAVRAHIAEHASKREETATV